MPLVNFDAVATLFRDTASTQVKIAPPTTQRSSNQEFSPKSFLNGFGSQTSPQPAAPNNVDAIKMRQAYAGGLKDTRIGFVLTTDMWRLEGKALALHAGPASADWSLALRAAEEETKAGRARYAQARQFTRASHDQGSTFFDFPRVNFQFQGGNILPIQGFSNEVVRPPGLEDFYLFFELLNQPPLLPSGQYEGAHNFVWIFYTSLMFPQVTLKGYFDPNGLSWEDTADEPTMLRWTSEFLVYEMTPNLWDTDELYTAYSNFMTTNGTLR